MKAQLINVSDLSSVADELGRARAEMKEIKDKVSFLESILLDSDESVVEGDFFRVALSRNVERETVNWKKIAAKFEPSRQLVRAYTRFSTFNRVNISALKK